ncbi:cation transporter [Natrinema pellirubrum DSM 15624]|uniref:Cation transporter n=1 Tax=Natrinema pellirubrum (strain DSM 15624 / CIP 106293 / JCM 10476 / NCIMB 786 / 157) TaxID=797303 RepID=L0JNI1_NATP1|nr:TrkH family potassium uptake protein [Natrinema pellirubrum]AGB31921.1 Trk-type K+ transport system, membrane component [Natrinema pellirubrum DSM 15624]ELY77734.1 cation transporter [Natrinema pellirubrum DSM 15624]
MIGRIHVDVRSSCSLLGTVLKFLSLSLLVPTAVALFYRESPLPFLVALVVAVGVGTGLERLEPEPDLEHREAFLLVALTWLVLPLVGTIPYLVAGTGTIAQPINALFESMSGFTTTGATVMGEISVETHSHSIMLWRQLTQWLGGMGIIVLMVAILSELSVGGTQLIREEAPGIQVEKLTPRIRQTARALWLIYVWFTLAAVVVYYGLHLVGLAPNMTFYNAVSHALTTLPTGGFSPEGRSVEAFEPIVQWAVMPFMIVAGTNFALYWHVWRGKPDRLTGNAEFRSYLLSMGVVGVLLSAPLFLGVGLATVPDGVAAIPGSLERSLRHGLFQTLAIVTTTGYASMDFNTWSESTQVILLFAMFLGGSAGSAAGSIKIIRWYVVGKSIERELFTTVHPQAVRPVRMGDTGDVIDEEAIHGIFVFIVLFLTLFAVSTVLLFLDAYRTPGLELTALEAISATIATLGNVGPGVGVVGPMNSYEPFSGAAKLYMTFLMWIGRLEILSVLVILTPAYWRS